MDRDKYLYSSLLFSICIIGSVLLFVPKMVGLQLVGGSENNKLPIYDSIKSEPFRDSVVCAISLSIPALLEFFLDLNLKHITKWESEDTSRFLIIFGMLLPSTVTLFFAVPYEYPDLVILLIRFRAFMLLASTAIITFTTFNSLHCTMIVTSVFFAVGYISLDLRCYSTNQVFEILSGVFIIGGFVLFTYLSNIICRKYWRSFRSNGSLTSKEYICLVYLISTIVTFCGMVLESLLFGPVINSQSSGYHLAFSSYLQCPIILITTIIQGRIYRKEKIMYQVCKVLFRAMYILVHDFKTGLYLIFLSLTSPL